MEKQSGVLIVDDDKGMTETLADLLKEFGYYVEVTDNGFDAIERARAYPFDVILMDVRMPGINGVETYKKIKGIRPEAAVMMMTAYSVEELVAEALEEGAYGVLYKPFDVEEVIEFIERVEESALLLVVDDDLSTCETLIDILGEKGYRVGWASRGEEAIKLVRERDFDIVFIDIRMPVMNGLEVYLELKRIRPDIKAIMMTAYRQKVQDLVDEALMNNAFTCIYKPIDVEKLLKVVEEILRN